MLLPIEQPVLNIEGLFFNTKLYEHIWEMWDPTHSNPMWIEI
jgi:hypothetical protein